MNDVVNAYKNLEWERIQMRQLGEAGSLERALPNLNRAKAFMDKLLDQRVLEALPQDALQEIRNQVLDFINFFTNQIFSYSDVSQRDTKLVQIQNRVGQLLNALGKYSLYFDVLPEQSSASTIFDQKIREISESREAEVTQLRDIRSSFETDQKTFERARNLAGRIVDEADLIETALKNVQEYSRANEEAIRTLLERNATSFAQKAQEHVSYIRTEVPVLALKKITFLNLNQIRQPSWRIGSIVWLWLGLLFGMIVMGIVGYFVFANVELTIESAILRVAFLVVPSYFAVLFTNQFLTQRKLYESYKFKDISLQTMIQLRQQFKGDHEAMKELLRRSMSVIFTEPNLRENGKVDQQLVSELIKLLRDK